MKIPSISSSHERLSIVVSRQHHYLTDFRWLLAAVMYRVQLPVVFFSESAMVAAPAALTHRLCLSICLSVCLPLCMPFSCFRFLLQRNEAFPFFLLSTRRSRRAPKNLGFSPSTILYYGTCTANCRRTYSSNAVLTFCIG